MCSPEGSKQWGSNLWQECSSKYLGRLHSSLLVVQPQREGMCDHSLLRSERESSWEIPHQGGGLALNISFQPGSVHSSALVPTVFLTPWL